MDNPTGIIQALVTDARGTRAIIDVDVGTACPRCAAGKGCGAGLLVGSSRLRRVEASFNASLDLTEGDNVEIELTPKNLLQAALIVYGLPMLGAIAAAGFAYVMVLGDAAAASAAIVGLLGGLVVSRWRLQQTACLGSFVPRVAKRLRGAQAGLS
jgi:sigma-E factor negative regulatory protein RseC